MKTLGSKTPHLEQEFKTLKWINQRIRTPNPVYYDRTNDTEYQLTTEITGTPIYLVKTEEREIAVKILAQTLKKIHQINPQDCPNANPVQSKKEKLATINFAPSQKALYEQIRTQSFPEKLVFTHGDYCLPNIIMENEKLGGVIDWDYAGIADPYTDFVSVVWSLNYNFGEQDCENMWIPLFFEEYGVKIDQDKMKYYRALSDLLEL